MAPSSSTERILRAAIDELDAAGPAGLSLERVAERSGVSRATVYRNFPRRTALLLALADAYSPFAEMRRLLAAHWDQPPAVVLPAAARAVVSDDRARSVVARAMLWEALGSHGPEAEGLRGRATDGLLPLMLYLHERAGGPSRDGTAIVAFATFIGPMMVLLSRSFLEDLLGADIDPPYLADEVVRAWLTANPASGPD